MTDNITQNERRELRSVVRGQFKVLRAEVKRRAEELRAEGEAQLLDRYRAEDEAIAEAHREVGKALQDYVLAVQKIGKDLGERFPDLTVEAGLTIYGQVKFEAKNKSREQLRRAWLAAIPDRIGDANLSLDRQENDLLRRLSVGALETDEARGFVESIPTVGELVPAMRLREIEQQIQGTS